MKKITLLVVLVLVSLVANAALPYDYSTFFASSAINSNGTLLETGNAAAALAWNVGSTAGATNPSVENSTLSYTSGLAYNDNALGKQIILPYNALLAEHRSVFNLATNTTTYTAGVYYLSALINVSDAAASSTMFMSLEKTATATAQRGRVYMKSSGAGFELSTGVSSSTSSASSELAFNTTHLIVIKYSITGAAALDVSLFINPVIGGSEGSPTLIGTQTTGSGTEYIRGVTVIQRANVGLKIAGLRFGTSWADVIGQSAAAPLTAPAVGTATAITANGFTAAWTQVANAEGYDVKVYLGANLISTTNVSGQATESLAITGLMSGLTYTYKVVAKGNITNYSDSGLSDASLTATTLDPFASNALNTDFSDVSWGEEATVLPATGSYPSSSINGFELNSAILYTGSIKGIKGELHTNRIAMDRLSSTGRVILPTVNSLEQIEIHATAGTAGNGFQLKEFDAATNTWIAIGGTYVYDANSKAAGTDSIYIISISRSVPTKFRIENPTNGGIYLLQVITRTTNPALLPKPIVGTTSGISSSGFTTNWTAVANATAYKVFVSDAISSIAGSPFTAIGQSTESLTISDLTDETAYTFKVQAIGDGDVSFSDSFLSFASAVTTSIVSSLDEINASNFAVLNGKKILLTETGNVSIFNLQGAQVYKAINVNSVNTNVATGMYVLQFTNSEGKQFIRKISIQ